MDVTSIVSCAASGLVSACIVVVMWRWEAASRRALRAEEDAGA